MSGCLMTFVDSQQFELEAFDIFLAPTVVTNYANACLLSQIVLVFVEEDLCIAN